LFFLSFLAVWKEDVDRMWKEYVTNHGVPSFPFLPLISSLPAFTSCLHFLPSLPGMG
jgi:hypothetical protein